MIRVLDVRFGGIAEVSIYGRRCVVYPARVAGRDYRKRESGRAPRPATEPEAKPRVAADLRDSFPLRELGAFFVRREDVEWIPKQSNGHWIVWADGFVLDPMGAVVGLQVAPPATAKGAPRILTSGGEGRVVSCLSIVSASPTLG